MLKAIPEQYADKEIAKFYLINKINNKKYYLVDSFDSREVNSSELRVFRRAGSLNNFISYLDLFNNESMVFYNIINSDFYKNDTLVYTTLLSKIQFIIEYGHFKESLYNSNFLNYFNATSILNTQMDPYDILKVLLQSACANKVFEIFISLEFSSRSLTFLSVFELFNKFSKLSLEERISIVSQAIKISSYTNKEKEIYMSQFYMYLFLSGVDENIIKKYVPEKIVIEKRYNGSWEGCLTFINNKLDSEISKKLFEKVFKKDEECTVTIFNFISRLHYETSFEDELIDFFPQLKQVLNMETTNEVLEYLVTHYSRDIKKNQNVLKAVDLEDLLNNYSKYSFVTTALPKNALPISFYIKLLLASNSNFAQYSEKELGFIVNSWKDKNSYNYFRYEYGMFDSLLLKFREIKSNNYFTNRLVTYVIKYGISPKLSDENFLNSDEPDREDKIKFIEKIFYQYFNIFVLPDEKYRNSLRRLFVAEYRYSYRSAPKWKNKILVQLLMNALCESSLSEDEKNKYFDFIRDNLNGVSLITECDNFTTYMKMALLADTIG